MEHEKLRRFSQIAKADIFYEKTGFPPECLGGVPDDNPIAQCGRLRAQLRGGADMQKEPFLMRDEFEAFFACIHPAPKEYYYLGPLCIARLSGAALRKFYRSYGIEPEDVRSPHLFTLQEALYVVEFAAEFLTGETCSGEELLRLNHISEHDRGSVRQEQISFFLDEEYSDDMDETWRHTYRQEQMMTDAIQEGRVEDALELNHVMDDDSGRLGDREFDHWKTLSVVAITLCARAAIKGGLAPETAYRISGYYILRCNRCQTVSQVMDMRDLAVQDLASRVREKKKRQSRSAYTETCKNYIARHYREKIYLEDAAKALGISPSYLSHHFRETTGIRFQDYVNQVRVNRAANLLRYSDLTLSAIAEYVRFPSQSYFGKIFKAQMHMTPREYREQFRTPEWTQEPE